MYSLDKETCQCIVKYWKKEQHKAQESYHLNRNSKELKSEWDERRTRCNIMVFKFQNYLSSIP